MSNSKNSKKAISKILFIKNKNKFIDRTGEFHINNQKCKFKIIAYYGSQNITVEFEDGTILENVEYCQILRGTLKNNNFPSVLSKGRCTEGHYSSKTHYSIYSVWHSMLSRCYDKKYQEKQPAYIGCYVDNYLLNFQNFAKWFEENYKEGFHLDKDILVKGNKVYSPQTCCFVPQEINCLFTKSTKLRGNLPIGVSRLGSRFVAQVNINSKRVHLGCFATPVGAFQAYKTAKEQYIKEVADRWKGQITKEVYHAMYNYNVEIND